MKDKYYKILKNKNVKMADLVVVVSEKGLNKLLGDDSDFKDSGATLNEHNELVLNPNYVSIKINENQVEGIRKRKELYNPGGLSLEVQDDFPEKNKK